MNSLNEVCNWVNDCHQQLVGYRCKRCKSPYPDRENLIVRALFIQKHKFQLSVLTEKETVVNHVVAAILESVQAHNQTPTHLNPDEKENSSTMTSVKCDICFEERQRTVLFDKTTCACSISICMECSFSINHCPLCRVYMRKPTEGNLCLTIVPPEHVVNHRIQQEIRELDNAIADATDNAIAADGNADNDGNADSVENINSLSSPNPGHDPEDGPDVSDGDSPDVSDGDEEEEDDDNIDDDDDDDEELVDARDETTRISSSGLIRVTLKHQFLQKKNIPPFLPSIESSQDKIARFSMPPDRVRELLRNDLWCQLSYNTSFEWVKTAYKSCAALHSWEQCAFDGQGNIHLHISIPLLRDFFANFIRALRALVKLNKLEKHVGIVKMAFFICSVLRETYIVQKTKMEAREHLNWLEENDILNASIAVLRKTKRPSLAFERLSVEWD